ncbi:cleavage and polyadenylation specificity factor subunit 1 [Nematocida displodere]|uniref:Cleavage and polyadenylation specificity factor subunit 1 n=1 Tax=Nematocida displodere TaxID=1805483 RepID=A0A177EJ92_9MICR|nr:cleavage and polyadenylation specificity factor subunit 1 [Nematocida displodere]
MNHLLRETYAGDLFQHAVLGRFLPNTECLLAGTCDRIFLYAIESGELKKIKEKRLFASLAGLSLLRGEGREGSTDGAILHFEQAKISKVFFSEEENEFVTTSLMYFEKQEYGITSETDKGISLVRIDTHHRLGFMLISRTHCALFSMHATGRIRVIEVCTLRPRHCIIKDVAFLQGFSVPTLCFLYEDTSAEKCRASVYVVDEEERELSLFFSIESIPHGCYSVVPTEDRVFMVLGANGAIFYSQWEMVGVCFNTFWNIDHFGIEEAPFNAEAFVIEGARCLCAGRDIFLFSEERLLRFSVLGIDGRVSRVLAEEVSSELPMDTPLSSAVYGGMGCLTTLSGAYVFALVPAEVQIPHTTQAQSIALSNDFKEMFLSDVPAESSSIDPDLSLGAEKVPIVMQPENIEREYAEMFHLPPETEARQRETQATTLGGATTHAIELITEKESNGYVKSATVVSYTERQKEYLFACGTVKKPLFVEMKEGIEFDFSHTAKIKGYLDMFAVNKAQNMYLVTKEGESVIVAWNETIETADGEIDKAARTLEFQATPSGYVQVTESSLIFLTGGLKRQKEARLEGVAAAEYASGRVLVITGKGELYVYTGLKKAKVPIPQVKSIATAKDRVFCIDTNNALHIYSVTAKRTTLVSQLLPLFPAVIESVSKENERFQQLAQNSAKSSTVIEVLAVEYAKSLFLVLRTANNEIVVYRESGERLLKERVTNNQFYYEKEGFLDTRKQKRMRVCRNLVVVPGYSYSRVLCFTKEGAFIHRLQTPVESVEETSTSTCQCPPSTTPPPRPEHSGHPGHSECTKCLEAATRTFVVLAKGNLAEGTLSPNRYDRAITYRRTRVASICERVVYYPEKKLFIASAFTEIEYTKDMMPFTVSATTELEADKLPPVEIPSVELKPKTRGYSIEIFSQKELRNAKAGETLSSVDKFGLDTNEYVSFHKLLRLPDKQCDKGASEFIVVCTTYITDEDLISTGRLIVLEVASVVPERNRKETKHKLKPLAAERTKGTTTACEEIKGGIAVCVGTKLMVYSFDRNEGLKAIAFHDMQVFLTSCAVLRNILVCGDAYKGVFLLFYQQVPSLLHMLSQSTGSIYLLKGVAMALHGESCGVLSYDSWGHLYIHSYSPLNMLSQKGSRLITRAESKLPDVVVGTQTVPYGANFKVLLFTKSGYVYKHEMVEENKYASLLDLQHSTLPQIKMVCGTAPSSHWTIEKHAEMRDITIKEMLQSGVAEEYFEMGRVRQAKISSDAGRDSSGAVKAELLFFRHL